MKPKIVILLNTSIYIPRDFKKIKNFIFKYKKRSSIKKSNIQWGIQRIQQYSLGIERLKELEIFNLYENIIFTDNTLGKKILLPRKIKRTLPRNTQYILRRKNNLGKYNKGAGLVENLKFCLDSLNNYDYMIYFEPRLYALNNKFFKRFLKSPGNVFYKNKNDFKSGYFGVSIIDFTNFIKSLDTDLMIQNSLTIETLLFDYFKNITSDFIEEPFTKRNIGYVKGLKINDENSYEIY